jgi:hypothetical protein
MKRRSGAGGAVSKARGRKTAKPKRRNPPNEVVRSSSSLARHQADVGRLTRELNKARGADSNVGSAPSRQPLSRRRAACIRGLAGKTVRICDATFGNIFRYDGDGFHL